MTKKGAGRSKVVSVGRHERLDRARLLVRQRGIALLGAAMIAAGGIWAALAIAGSTEVEIEKPSGQDETVTIDESHPDWKTYRYEGENKEGRSLASVLKEIGIGDRAWTSIDVEGLMVQNGSFKRKKPPIFFIKGSNDEVTFYRPETGSSSAETRSATGSELEMSYRVPLDLDASDNTPEGRSDCYLRGGRPEGKRPSERV